MTGQARPAWPSPADLWARIFVLAGMRGYDDECLLKVKVNYEWSFYANIGFEGLGTTTAEGGKLRLPPMTCFVVRHGVVVGTARRLRHTVDVAFVDALSAAIRGETDGHQGQAAVESKEAVG